MPFPSSTPPLQPIRYPLCFRTQTNWQNPPTSSVFGTSGGSPAFGVTGTNAGGSGYLASGISGLRLIPAAGADATVRHEGSNNAQRLAGSFVPLLQGGPNPYPGLRWEMHYRMALGVTLTPNTTGEDTQALFGIGSDFGFVFSRPRGPWVGFSAIGDAGANWRVWAIDGDLGGGGSVTLNVDTGVAFTAAPQALEIVWGNDGANNFVRFLIDGSIVYEPTLPVNISYPTTETGINFYAGANRGADAADVIQVDIPDDVQPCVFVDVYP